MRNGIKRYVVNLKCGIYEIHILCTEKIAILLKAYLFIIFCCLSYSMFVFINNRNKSVVVIFYRERMSK